MLKILLLVSLIPVLLAVAARATPVRILFVNADVQTLDASDTRASALLIRGAKVLALGEVAERAARQTRGTRVIDLGGRSVLPGFVDAHSHFPASHLVRAGLDLSAPPVGTVTRIDTLLSRIETAAATRERGEWILGFNYDNALLDAGRHPTREALDRVAPEHPVWLAHGSGHMGVANSAALHALGRDISGNGLLREHEMPDLATLIRALPKRRLLDVFVAAREDYLAAGMTTVQNGYANAGIAWLLWAAQRVGFLPQRVVIWPARNRIGDRRLSTRWRDRLSLPPADHHLVMGATKLLVDGSPQGLTAWLARPYPDSAEQPAGWTGIRLMDRITLYRVVARYEAAGLQLAIHGNGDGAIDAILGAIERARRFSTGSTGSSEPLPPTQLHESPRHIIVHAQTVRADQLRRMAELGVSASFFPSHTFYWGDWHRDRALGAKRARRISPLAEADALGVRYSIHTDAPVTPVRPMQVLWSATERRTLSDQALGPEFRIDRLRALRAMTIDSAWQNHLEAEVGSLEVGKRADLIVLSDDPLAVEDVRTIRVDETWIDGVRRYRRQSPVTWMREIGRSVREREATTP